MAYKRFPNRFSTSSQEKVQLNSNFSCGKKDNAFSLWNDKLKLFSRSCSCSGCKKDEWKHTLRKKFIAVGFLIDYLFNGIRIALHINDFKLTLNAKDEYRSRAFSNEILIFLSREFFFFTCKLWLNFIYVLIACICDSTGWLQKIVMKQFFPNSQSH